MLHFLTPFRPNKVLNYRFYPDFLLLRAFVCFGSYSTNCLLFTTIKTGVFAYIFDLQHFKKAQLPWITHNALRYT